MLSALEIGIGVVLPGLVLAHLLVQARSKPQPVPVKVRKSEDRRAPRGR